MMRKFKIRTKQPWIAYPSTPVCQNYAEGGQPHGYLLWDVKQKGSWSVTFRDLPEPHPFVTVDWNGSLEVLKQLVERHPEQSRYRVRSSVYMSQEEIRQVADYLKIGKRAIDVVFKLDQTYDKDLLSAGGADLVREDLRNVDVQMLLLQDYYGGSTISDMEWQGLRILVQKYMQQATGGEDIIRNTKWSIRGMEFSNLFTYGKGNFINFERLSGIIGIFGPNRCGKSSIPGSLVYGLFNGTDRGAVKNLHVVNSRKGFGAARITIAVNGVEYVINRETHKTDTKKGITLAPTTLTVEQVNPDGTTTLLTGEERKDTEKVIRKLIGTQEDFFLTSMAKQGSMGLTQFIDEGSAFRKLILTKFLDLDVFEKMHEQAKNDLNTTKAELKAYPSRDWDEERKTLTEKLQGYDNFLEKADEKLDAARAELHDVQVQIALHKDVEPVKQEHIDETQNALDRAQKMADDADASQATFQAALQKTLTSMAKVKEELAAVDIQALKAARDSERALEKSITALKHQHEIAHGKQLTAEKSIKRLEMVPCGDDYPTCMFIKDSHEDRQRLPDLLKAVDEAKAALSDAEMAFGELKSQNLKARIDAWTQLSERLGNLERESSNAKLSIERGKASVEKIATTMESLKKRLEKLVEAAKNQDSALVADLRDKLELMQANVRRLDKLKLEAATSRGRTESELQKLQKQQEAYTKLTFKQRMYELVANAFSKKGIPTKIINSQLPIINQEIATILHGIVDYTVELEADVDSNAMEIYLNYGDSRRLIELGSGMEKTIAAIAIRVALLNVTSLPKTDMFIMDEGFGTLDESQVEACNRLLMSLKRHFRTVILITHMDAVKDAADTILEITRDGKDSRVYVE